MDLLAEKLDARLRTWAPATAAQVRERVAEVIELADENVIDTVGCVCGNRKVWTFLMNPQPSEGFAGVSRPG